MKRTCKSFLISCLGHVMLKVIFPSVLWKIFHASSAIRDGRFNLEHLGYISQLRHNIVISVNLSHSSQWRIQTLS